MHLGVVRVRQPSLPGEMPRSQPAKQTSSRPPDDVPIIDAGQRSVNASLPITRRKYTDEDPHTEPVRPRASSANHAATGPFFSLPFPPPTTPAS